MFLVAILIFSSGCKKYSNFETDEYFLKFPTTQSYLPEHTKDTTIVKLKLKKTQYNVSVITKNNIDYYTLNDCVSKELDCFLQGKNTKNIVTKETKINGSDATLINGVNILNDTKIYWSFAVIPSDYKYYIIRVSSQESFLSFNEYFNQEIIYSFHLK